MGDVWQLQEAKNRLSEVIQRTVQKGPQTITVRGKPMVVVLSVEEYERLTRPKTGLLEFFRNSPLVDVDLDVERTNETPREVEL